jgi:hypothetical protein
VAQPEQPAPGHCDAGSCAWSPTRAQITVAQYYSGVDRDGHIESKLYRLAAEYRISCAIFEKLQD